MSNNQKKEIETCAFCNEKKVRKNGRPPKFHCVDEVETKIDKYLRDCKMNKLPLTVTGLAIALDTSRKVLLDYQNDTELKDFSDTIKKAKLLCENYAEQRLHQGGQVAGTIFSLKNNWGWVDKTEVDQNVKVSGLEVKFK